MTRPNITPGPWINNADTVHMGRKPAFLAVCSPLHHPQSVANARAIAAVPALLNALEIIHANAAESPEWIRRHTTAALIAAGYQF